MNDAQIEQTLAALLHQRVAGASTCPCEVALMVAPEGWRALMPPVRAAASRLAVQGLVHITQRG